MECRYCRGWTLAAPADQRTCPSCGEPFAPDREGEKAAAKAAEGAETMNHATCPKCGENGLEHSIGGWWVCLACAHQWCGVEPGEVMSPTTTAVVMMRLAEIVSEINVDLGQRGIVPTIVAQERGQRLQEIYNMIPEPDDRSTESEAIGE